MMIPINNGDGTPACSSSAEEEDEEDEEQVVDNEDEYDDETSSDMTPIDDDTTIGRHTPLLHAALKMVKKKNGLVQIELSTKDAIQSVDRVDRFPKERRKAAVAVALLFVAAILNDLVLAYIHEKVPDTAPLPDIFFSNTPYVPWALVASEYVMLLSFSSLFLLGLLHRHRWIVLRRVTFIGALLYFGRAVSMFVTQVPVADPKYFCSPKLKASDVNLSLLLVRALNLVSGVGLKINGKQTLCGDYIYSGHTVVLICTYLFIREFVSISDSPRRWWLLHTIAWILSATGVTLLLLSRGHYTVDVLIAYWITTRVFWIYHTLAAYPILKDPSASNNHLAKVYWFPIFHYMEGNVHSPVPRRFDWPLPWPRCLIRRIKSNIR